MVRAIWGAQHRHPREHGLAGSRELPLVHFREATAPTEMIQKAPRVPGVRGCWPQSREGGGGKKASTGAPGSAPENEPSAPLKGKLLPGCQGPALGTRDRGGRPGSPSGSCRPARGEKGQKTESLSPGTHGLRSEKTERQTCYRSSPARGTEATGQQCPPPTPILLRRVGKPGSSPGTRAGVPPCVTHLSVWLPRPAFFLHATASLKAVPVPSPRPGIQEVLNTEHRAVVPCAIRPTWELTRGSAPALPPWLTLCPRSPSAPIPDAAWMSQRTTVPRTSPAGPPPPQPPTGRAFPGAHTERG